LSLLLLHLLDSRPFKTIHPFDFLEVITVYLTQPDMPSLPPLAPFPKAPWRQRLSSQEWESLLEAWTALSHALLGLSDKDFKAALSNDDSVLTFLASFAEETAEAGTSTLGSHSTLLMRAVFQLCVRVLTFSPPQYPQLLGFPFLADLARIFPRRVTVPLLQQLFRQHSTPLESSLSSLKKLLIPQLDAGINGDLKLAESQLTRLNHLLHVSPDACTLFLAGSDFFDGLVTCFQVMNPPLRSVIITTTYLCMVGLIEAEPPKWSMLGDQLYALKSAADAHKAGPLNARESLVPELVTNTPLLNILLRRAEDAGAATDNLKKRITALEGFKNGAMVRPKRLVRRKVNKGKGKETEHQVEAEMHIHKMSQISQIQDLFPDLGSGFVAKCLAEYADDVEQVVANLLGESLPPHLANADRAEPLYDTILTPNSCSKLLMLLDHHMLNEDIQSWCLVQHLLNSRHDIMFLMMMNSIVLLMTRLSFHLGRTPRKLPMMFSRTSQMPPTRRQFCLLLQRSTRMTTNAMIRTMPPMLVERLMLPTTKPMRQVTAMRRHYSKRIKPTPRCLIAMPQPGGVLLELS
jgi:hypothetical protein